MEEDKTIALTHRLWRHRKKDGTLGDLRATLEVTVPHDLSSKAKSALEDLRIATAGPDPREELLRRARQE